jgi:hypothetical protein
MGLQRRVMTMRRVGADSAGFESLARVLKFLNGSSIRVGLLAGPDRPEQIIGVELF